MANFDATSGSYTTRLTVTETATSTPNNTSTVTFSLTLIKNSGTGLWNNDSCSWSININGTSYNGTFTYDFRDYSSLTLKSSTTQTITHDSDGTKKIAVSASVNMDNTPYVYTMSPSGELTLATIPRASDIALSVSSFSITSASGNAFTWTITAKSNSFYNRLRYSIGNKTNVSSNKGQGSSNGYFTNQELLSALPTSTSGSLTVYCDTYSDSGYSNLVGTKSVVITVSVNTSYIKPSVSLGDIVINSTPITSHAVAGYSTLRDTFSTSNSYGASSVTTYFSISTGSLQTTSTSSTSGTIYTNTLPQSSSNYTITIYAYAKDSRGAVGDTVSKSFGVWGYEPPTASLSAYRTTSSTSTSEDGAGTYVYVTFSGAVRSSVDNQNSVQVISCSYWGDISGQATNGGHYALSDTQTATFQLSVTDKVASSTARVTISSASYPLDLVDDGNGNTGVGLGTIAQVGYVKTPLTFRIDNNNSAGGFISIWEDGEGGNIEIGSKSGKAFQIDAYNDNVLRVWARDDNGNYKEATFNRTDGTLACSGGFNGWARTAGTADSATYATDASNADVASRIITPRTSVNVNDIEAYTSTTTRTTFYEAQSDAPNIPSSHYFYIQTMRGADSRYASQLAYGQTVNTVYKREYYNNTWWGWKKVEESEVLWTGTLKGGGNVITLATGGYSLLRVYFQSYSGTGIFYFDTQTQAKIPDESAWPYVSSGFFNFYLGDSGLVEQHYCVCKLNPGRSQFKCSQMGYVKSGTTYSRNNDDNYYVYKIEGIV